MKKRRLSKMKMKKFIAVLAIVGMVAVTGSRMWFRR